MARRSPRPRSPGSALAGAALGLVACATATHAWGNGRFPSAQMVVLGGDPARPTVALRTTFGVLVSGDTGRTWDWRCEEMLGYAAQRSWDPAIALGARGADGVPLLVGLPTGLARSRESCASERVPELGDAYTGDLAASPDGATVYWVSSSADRPNRVWVSRDGGRRFEVLSEPVSGVLFETVEVAPSNPSRLYLSGVTLEDRHPVLYRSDDGGRTLRELPVARRDLDSLFVSGVSAANPDVVFVRGLIASDGGVTPIAGSVLLRSDDGLGSLREVFSSRGMLLGFALADDGHEVWVGGRDGEGLQRSTDAGDRWEPLSGAQVQCLRWHRGELWVCANEFVDGYALGRSRDGGRTVSPVLRLGDLREAPRCAASTGWGQRCAAQWPYLQSVLRPLRDAGPEAMDAGAPVDAGGPRTTPDCDCDAGGAPESPGAAGLVAIALVGAVSRRARRPGRARSG